MVNFELAFYQEVAMSCRDEILKCVSKILQRTGKEEFTMQEVIDYMRRTGSKYKESTIRTHIASRLCANAPVHHAVTYDDLERTDRGTHRIKKPSKMGQT